MVGRGSGPPSTAAPFKGSPLSDRTDPAASLANSKLRVGSAQARLSHPLASDQPGYIRSRSVLQHRREGWSTAALATIIMSTRGAARAPSARCSLNSHGLLPSSVKEAIPELNFPTIFPTDSSTYVGRLRVGPPRAPARGWPTSGRAHLRPSSAAQPPCARQPQRVRCGTGKPRQGRPHEATSRGIPDLEAPAPFPSPAPNRRFCGAVIVPSFIVSRGAAAQRAQLGAALPQPSERPLPEHCEPTESPAGARGPNGLLTMDTGTNATTPTKRTLG